MRAVNLAEKLATFSEHFKSRTIQLRDGDVHLAPGEMYVVPKGVEHRPVAEEVVI